MLIKKIVPALICLFLWSCQSPTNSIDHDIKKFKADYKDNFVTYQVHGRTMQYAWSGDKNQRPLLFVHGSPGSLDAWSQFMLDEKLQQNFHLIAVDRPGYGGSDAGVPETSLQKQAADIIEVLKSNQSGKKAILVGHSFGGPVIARLAMDYPEKIAGIIIVSGSVDPSQEHIAWYQYPADWFVFRWMIPSWLRVCNEEIMPLKGELEKMLPLWPQLQSMVYVIHGTQDDLVPYENAAFIQQHTPSEKFLHFESLEGMNHFVPWRRADAIKNAIYQMQDFIGRDSATTASHAAKAAH